MDNIQHDLIRVIRGKKYNTETATLIASRLSTGVGEHLYRTEKGAYFVAYSTIWKVGRSTIWEGARDTIAVLSVDQALEIYQQYKEEEPFSVAFPDVNIVDA